MEMSKRKIATACIVADAAENGKATKIGIRAYIEGGISRRTFNEAILIGQKIYQRKLSKEKERR